MAILYFSQIVERLNFIFFCPKYAEDCILGMERGGGGECQHTIDENIYKVLLSSAF